MLRLLLIAVLFLNAPALAQPQVTVLLPTPGSMTPQDFSDAFRDHASVRAGLPGTPINLIADSLYTSDVALHILDATQGPVPRNRELVLAARQARASRSIVLVTNVDQLFQTVGLKDGAELLALIEGDMRLLMELYGIGGVDTAVYHDSAVARRATGTMVGDLAQLAADLGAMDGGTREAEALQPVSEVAAEIYLLANEEAPGHAVRIKRTTTLDVWIGGKTASAEITAGGLANPADVASIHIRPHEPLPAATGTRLLLLRNDHIVGLGVVAEVPER